MPVVPEGTSGARRGSMLRASRSASTKTVTSPRARATLTKVVRRATRRNRSGSELGMRAPALARRIPAPDGIDELRDPLRRRIRLRPGERPCLPGLLCVVGVEVERERLERLAPFVRVAAV